jgi:hypothetical protein
LHFLFKYNKIRDYQDFHNELLCIFNFVNNIGDFIMNISKSAQILPTLPVSKDANTHQRLRKTIFSPLGILCVLTLVMIFALMYFAAINLDGSSSVSNRSNLTSRLPPPTNTPSVGYYLDKESSHITEASSRLTPSLNAGKYVSILDLLSIIIIFVLLILSCFLFLNNIIAILSKIESNNTLAFNSLANSISFIITSGYLAMYREFLSMRGIILYTVRRIVISCSILGIVLGILGLAIILSEREILVETLILVGFTCVFPLSYLVYNLELNILPRSSTQENKRVNVERLALDFMLSSPGTPAFDGTSDINFDVVSIFKKKALHKFEKYYSWREYAVYITLAVVFTILGLMLFILETPATSSFITGGTLSAMRFGFIGGYLFSFFLLYERYANNDLQPGVYMYCALTILAGMSFNYIAFQALSTLVADQQQVIGEGALAIIAFALGFFPLLARRWLSQIVFSALGVRRGRSEQLSLDLIDGIDTYHEIRLHDISINSIDDLINAELHDLITRTPFGSQQIVSWIDQALLYVRLTPEQIEIFRGNSIRTISDFWAVWDYATNESPQDQRDRRIEKLALQLQRSSEQLESLYKTTYDDPNAKMVRFYWENKPKEGLLTIALDRPTRGLEIVQKYHTALVYGAIFARENKDEQEKIALINAAKERNNYVELTGSLPPDPLSPDGKMGLRLMYAAAYEPEPKKPTDNVENQQEAVAKENAGESASGIGSSKDGDVEQQQQKITQVEKKQT